MAEKKVTTKTITTEELVKKKPVKRKMIVKDSENAELNRMLVENFVSLQKVLTSLSSKFDDMTKKLSEVLDLFEESAKAFVKKDIQKEQSSAIWQKEITDNHDFIKELKFDALSSRIFVLTPNGDVKDLPEGATPIDFAYAVHSDIGSHCESAKIGGKIVQLNHALENGDIVEIITNKNKKPSKDWLRFVKTSLAM